MYTLPNLVLDLVAGLALRAVAEVAGACVYKHGAAAGSLACNSEHQATSECRRGVTPIILCTRWNPMAAGVTSADMFLTPNRVMALYLLNPLTLASCTGGTSTPLENCACLLALAAAARGSVLCTSLFLAIGTYVMPHCLLLLVRVVVWRVVHALDDTWGEYHSNLYTIHLLNSCRSPQRCS
jgi:hypothetical protein